MGIADPKRFGVDRVWVFGTICETGRYVDRAVTLIISLYQPLAVPTREPEPARVVVDGRAYARRY